MPVACCRYLVGIRFAQQLEPEKIQQNGKIRLNVQVSYQLQPKPIKNRYPSSSINFGSDGIQFQRKQREAGNTLSLTAAPRFRVLRSIQPERANPRIPIGSSQPPLSCVRPHCRGTAPHRPTRQPLLRSCSASEDLPYLRHRWFACPR